MRVRNLRTGIEGELRDNVARSLIALGKVEQVVSRRSRPHKSAVDDEAATDDTVPATYSRKDLRAEDRK